jgi:hypothetical protein
MNQQAKFGFAIFAIAMLFASLTSSAMTLGRPSGSVLMGQPLDLSVPIQLDVDEAASALCFEADVFYGDTKQGVSRAEVRRAQTAQAHSAYVWVSSALAVDEPVVTVYLRSGCDHKVTRRFVLLSEMPSKTVVIVNGAPDPVKTPRNAARPAANLITENGLQSALAPASDAALVKQGSRAPVQNVRRPHLQLSSRNLTEERTPSMAFSTQLPAVELADDKKRDEAALLWRSLNTTHDEAIGLLKNSADGSVEANPLVYLDLLRVLHTLGRKTEYDHYRTDFNALFSGRVPPYADFNQSGEGLEGYPEVCHMVESLWPSAEAIDYIEKNLVRNMGEGSEGGFDLEAFRDLLMLHGMAKRIDLISESGFMPFSAAKVNSPDVTAVSSYSLPDISPEAEIIAPVAGQVDAVSVDLDLSEHHGNLINFDAVDLILPSESNASKS